MGAFKELLLHLSIDIGSGTAARLSCAGVEFILGLLFLANDCMLLRASLMDREIAVLLFCAFSSRSISPNMVCPFIARFSSGIGANFMIPRSGGTLRMSAMKDCISAALRLFVVGCICDGNVVIVRM